MLGLGLLQYCLQALVSLNPENFNDPLLRDQQPFRVQDDNVKSKHYPSKTSPVPDYFQTEDGHFAGPTQTGSAPWLAQTNLAPFPGVSYIPNAPLETQVPILNNEDNKNIFESMAHLSPYFPNPRGFGVDEYPVPRGANVSWVNMIHRHGSRYPEFNDERAAARALGRKIMDAKSKQGFKATGPLAFLSDWQFMLGGEILVPVGKQQLFDSGTLHYYQYGHLFPNNGEGIIARTTTQKRMLESAEYFLAGFFGLGWTQNATLELVIEASGYNNTMAGYKACNHSTWDIALNATRAWAEVYLADAHQRLKSNISGELDWTMDDTYNAQTLCAYETVALGFSQWCSVFTLQEWKGFEYSYDIGFNVGAGFYAPMGRAIGIGYVQEVLARMQHHAITSPKAQINVTLDEDERTFPLNQRLNFDFSHDTNILSVLVAFGLRQFAEYLPTDHMKESREFLLSHLVPFASRLDIEVINAPHPVKANRKEMDQYDEGGPTSYVHFILNQRTIPLGRSLDACGNRDDGWCEMDTFLEVQKKQIELADFDVACFGDYEHGSYGDYTDGRPVKKEHMV